ncbi:MAG TPA: hypothetical protein ACFYD6_06965 [Candidatus Brocadiia bacterium]|nr:hypothetical protein [Planctomycetota bacterium]MBI4007540.1 hypothetical protein [Planctomycetota bacterium]MDO8093124.1 hypothetical protein [Candidatus Brocadiales bacterium]
MELDIITVKNRITSGEDLSLKTITDIVAYKIYESPENKDPASNYLLAESIVAEYITANFREFNEFQERLNVQGSGLEGLRSFADLVYWDYSHKKEIRFEAIRDRISRGKDITLRTITDFVAYKIKESPYDEGVEINLISAQTFIAQYISENFRDMEEFQDFLSRLGVGMGKLQKFAEIVYNEYCQKKSS